MQLSGKYDYTYPIVTSSKTLLSIVIVAYKSLTDLQRCLPSLFADGLNQMAHEIILIDNYGQDCLEAWLSHNYPTINYQKNPVNSGYSGGNNIGVAKACGQWTLLLNPDTELQQGCLLQLIDTAQANPNALINPKLLNPDGTINACGNQMHYTGITTCRALNEPSESRVTLEKVPLLSGAALLAPTKVLKALNGFDGRYFMYFEDTDLSLRARLLGYDLLCDSRAVIIHYYRLGMSASKFGHLERNRLITLLKTLSRQTLLRLLPALLLTELLTWAYALRGWSYLKMRLWGYRWLWRNRQWLREEHQKIQQTRLLADDALLVDSLSKLPFDQLVDNSVGRLFNQITYWLFRFLRPSAL